MHELSLIQQVVDTLYDFFEEKGEPVRHVHDVTLSVGAVAGIVPHYLTDAWSYFTKKDDLFKDSTLHIEIIHAISTCHDCGQDYDTIAHAKVCPHCGSENTVLKQGNEFEIKEVHVE